MTFTADYLTKKQVKNEGQLAQYHVKDDHEAIVSKELWEVVQLEIQRRKDYHETLRTPHGWGAIRMNSPSPTECSAVSAVSFSGGAPSTD